MKKKTLITLAAATFLAVSVTACGNTSSSGTQTPTATPTTTVSVNDNNTSSTGAAGSQNSSAEVTPSVPSPAGSQNTQNASEISEAEAKQIALDNAQVKESDLLTFQIKKDFDDGIYVYEIEFQSGNKQYEYDIKASDGQILKTDYEIDEDYVDSQTTQTAVSEADAKAAALARVEGSSDSDIRIKLERDDGRLVYEGKIIFNNTEYDFEIDANSGDFLKWEQESVFD